jgi:hypothetical protein
MHRSLVVAAMTLALALAAPAASQAAVDTNVRLPVDSFVFVPCANGGAGETVHLTGTVLVLFTTTSTESGQFITIAHFQPQGVSGVGETTGDRYRGTGPGFFLTRANLNLAANEVSTFLTNFRIIGPGAGNNLLIHNLFHLTVNGNGVVTAEVIKSSVECK